jgi:hypothetical protein
MASYLATGTSAPGDVWTNGKLGVGTGSPGATLDVNGNIKASGMIVIDSGFLKGKTSSAAGAPANAIYVDSSTGKLCYKDGDGTSHNLY